MSDTPNFEKINESDTPSKLNLAVIFYGIDTEDNPEAQQDAEDAATELIDLRAKEAELAALQAERDALKAENERQKEALAIAAELLKFAKNKLDGELDLCDEVNNLEWEWKWKVRYFIGETDIPFYATSQDMRES
jgi:hypothetical protein